MSRRNIERDTTTYSNSLLNYAVRPWLVLMHNRTGRGKNQEKRGSMRHPVSKPSVIGPINDQFSCLLCLFLRIQRALDLLREPARLCCKFALWCKSQILVEFCQSVLQ